MTMDAPSLARATTTALPMPLLPPVTMATFPSSVMVLLSGAGGRIDPWVARPPPSEPDAARILLAGSDPDGAGGHGAGYPPGIIGACRPARWPPPPPS